MSFLDENDGTVTTDNSAEAEKLSKKGVNVKLVDKMMQEANAFLAAADAARDAGKKEFEFPKGSGKMHKVTLKRNLDIEEGKLSNALGGVAVLASLLLVGKINSSDPVIQRLQAEYEQAEPAQRDSIKNRMTKRILFLDTGKADDSTPMNEDLAKFLRGGGYKTPVSDLLKKINKQLAVDKSDVDNDGGDKTDIGAEIQAKIMSGEATESEAERYFKSLEKAGVSAADIATLERRYKRKKAQRNPSSPTNEGNCGCGQTPCKTYGKMKEDKEEEFDYKAPEDKDKDDIRIDPDTKFQVDLRHLIQKHMKEGKSREDVIKITKALMAKLHNKGEVTVDGTKIIFKEIARPRGGSLTNKERLANLSPEERKEYLTLQAKLSDFKNIDLGGMDELDAPQDTQLALPKPPKPTANFLGPDNMDYEGGMAKSQMLKMKNYAKALCDMIDDETQLESWVQAKLTKASDYMSSVYHYLDYQQTKNINEETLNEETFNFPQADQYTLRKSKWGGEDGVGLDMPSSSKFREKDTDYILLKDTPFDNIDDLFNAFKKKLSNPNFTNDVFKRFANQTNGMILKNLKLVESGGTIENE